MKTYVVTHEGDHGCGNEFMVSHDIERHKPHFCIFCGGEHLTLKQIGGEEDE